MCYVMILVNNAKMFKVRSFLDYFFVITCFLIKLYKSEVIILENKDNMAK